MKDYLWVIIAGIFALLAFFFFIITINSTSSLIKRLRLKKINIILNILLLLIGIGNLGVATYLLLDVREQINSFNSFV